MLVVLSWLLIASCYAFKTMSIEDVPQNTVPYSLKGRPIGVDSNTSLALETPNDFRMPVTSRMQSGAVTRHAVDNAPGFSQAIFVVGDDEDSRDWLYEHKDLLQKLHALGFVTNVERTTHLHELEALVGMSLLPANVDGLSELLHVEHYPYVLHQGVVWQ